MGGKNRGKNEEEKVSELVWTTWQHVIICSSKFLMEALEKWSYVVGASASNAFIQ